MFNLLVGTDKILEEILNRIASAENYIYLQFMTFESDLIGKLLVDALTRVKNTKPDLKIRLMVDDYIYLSISDQKIYKLHPPFKEVRLLKEIWATHKDLYKLANLGINVKMTNPFTIFKPRSFWQRDHRKIVLIDDILLFGGYNISEHNHSWHDTFMVSTSKELVSIVKNIYSDKFERNFTEQKPIKGDSFTIYQNNNLILNQLQRVSTEARKQIYIESAYLNNDKLLVILQRKFQEGVNIKIILPEINNRPKYARINQKYLKLYPEFIEVTNFPRSMTHAKIALVDDLCIYGSACFNSDDVTEICIFIKNPEILKQFQNYFQTKRRMS